MQLYGNTNESTELPHEEDENQSDSDTQDEGIGDGSDNDDEQDSKEILQAEETNISEPNTQLENEEPTLEEDSRLVEAVTTIGDASTWSGTPTTIPTPPSPRGWKAIKLIASVLMVLAVERIAFSVFHAVSPGKVAYLTTPEVTRELDMEAGPLILDKSALEGDNEIVGTGTLTWNGERRHSLHIVEEVVDEVGPSVVRIDTETHQQHPSDTGPPIDNIQEGQGSGLLYSKDGYIVTNAHVVEDATKVKVTLTDGRVFRCSVRGTDEIVDIAVLQIEANGPIPDLPVARLGDSDKVRVGRMVIAVGTPGGLDNSVTSGIVSGVERSSAVVGIPFKQVDFIQTDAAINPGNSGGPLIDVTTGEVVGINAAIRSNMEGTSFAIPINRVAEIVPQLEEGQHLQHGYLGVGLSTYRPEFANHPHFGNTYAIVNQVFPGTPADNAGLQVDDLIMNIGGKLVESAEDARRLVDKATVGKEITIRVSREGKELTLKARPVDLASKLKQVRQDRQQQFQQEKQRYEELGPLYSLIR